MPFWVIIVAILAYILGGAFSYGMAVKHVAAKRNKTEIWVINNDGGTVFVALLWPFVPLAFVVYVLIIAAYRISPRVGAARPKGRFSLRRTGKKATDD